MTADKLKATAGNLFPIVAFIVVRVVFIGISSVFRALA